VVAPEVRVARSVDLSHESRAEIRALLTDAFDGDFSDDDWKHALGGWHVVATDGAVLAHAAVVARALDVDGRSFRAGYVDGVATTPLRQGEGLGAMVMRRVGELLEAEFELGALSTDRHAFYQCFGWERWHGPTFVGTATTSFGAPTKTTGSTSATANSGAGPTSS